MTLDEFSSSVEGDKFFKKVNKTDSCWLWTAGLMLGYGWLYDGTLKRNERAHRFIMVRLYGGVPKGKEVCHRCNVKKCVNPDHLYFGTRSENIRDQIVAGVHNFLNHGKRGMLSPNAKLTDTIVKKIKRMKTDGVRTVEISRILDLNESTVQNVISNHRWSHIPWPKQKE